MAVQAIRGAVSLSADSSEEVKLRTQLLLGEILKRNNLDGSQIISIFFTATSDISSAAPAAAVRAMQVTEAPLLCAQEMNLDGGLPLCIRCFIHIDVPDNDGVNHVFLGAAAALRPDLALPGDEEL